MNKTSLRNKTTRLREFKRKESKYLQSPSWKYFDKDAFIFRYDERWKYLDAEQIFLESKRIREVEVKEEYKDSGYEDYDGAAFLEDNIAKIYTCSSSKCFLSSLLNPNESDFSSIIEKIQNEKSKDLMEANDVASSSWGLLINGNGSDKENKIFYSTKMSFPVSLLNVIYLNEKSNLTVDIKQSSNNTFHEFTYIQLEKNSNLTLNILLSSFNYSSINNFKIKIGENSSLNLNLVQSSSSLCSSNIEVQLVGKHSKFNYKSLLQSSANSLVDNNLAIVHLEEDTHSKAEIFGIVKGGTIITKDWSEVAFESSSTFIKGKIILLSADSKAYAIPNLKTKGNRISASHGISLSKITQNELFYLMSRGLREDEATLLVSTGFIEHVLSSMNSKMLKSEEIKSYLVNSLKR